MSDEADLRMTPYLEDFWRGGKEHAKATPAATSKARPEGEAPRPNGVPEEGIWADKLKGHSTDDLIEAAIAHVGDLCAQRKTWRMCIPPQWDDSDCLLAGTLRRVRCEREQAKDTEQEVVRLRELLELAQEDMTCSCGIEDAPSPCTLCQIEEMLTTDVVTTYPDLEDAKTQITKVLSTTWMIRKSVREKAHAGPLFDQALDELVKEKAIDSVAQDEGIYRLRSGPKGDSNASV